VTRGPSDRSHLSIGEVLSLLQDEFPDVTISKIRFLESQGLLDPERTPSGYRKFYEDDIERLRWILRQQKDHYLPLKVIKDRLDGRDVLSEPPAALPLGEGARPAGRTDDRQSPPAGANGRRSTVNGHAALAVDERPPDAATGPEAPAGVGAATPASEPLPTTAPAARDDEPATGGQPGAGGTPFDWRVDSASLPGGTDASPAPAVPAGPVGGGGAMARNAADEHGAARAVAAGLVADARAPATARDAADDTTMPPGGPGLPGGPGPSAGAVTPEPDPLAAFVPEHGAPVSLTIDELAEVSGMTVRDLRDLERFGLLESHVVGDAAYYDADALVLARTAGGFLRHGIEARHLRSYKVAVDREAGLFEQIVLPLLKQRNPEAHRRAGRNLAELVHLGEVMRAVLLRRELRRHVEL
jgi:DNA-binding transcriptional MerR regulator